FGGLPVFVRFHSVLLFLGRVWRNHEEKWVCAARQSSPHVPCGEHRRGRKTMKVVVAITGASGALYARELISALQGARCDFSVVASDNAKIVWADELGEPMREAGFPLYGMKDFKAPFASGSAPYDQMVVIPCSMGTLGRIAHGISNDLITRAADVFL